MYLFLRLITANIHNINECINPKPKQQIQFAKKKPMKTRNLPSITINGQDLRSDYLKSIRRCNENYIDESKHCQYEMSCCYFLSR